MHLQFLFSFRLLPHKSKTEKPAIVHCKNVPMVPASLVHSSLMYKAVIATQILEFLRGLDQKVGIETTVTTYFIMKNLLNSSLFLYELYIHI